jgi:hypothetical protein
MISTKISLQSQKWKVHRQRSAVVLNLVHMHSRKAPHEDGRRATSSTCIAVPPSPPSPSPIFLIVRPRKTHPP